MNFVQPFAIVLGAVLMKDNAFDNDLIQSLSAAPAILPPMQNPDVIIFQGPITRKLITLAIIVLGLKIAFGDLRAGCETLWRAFRERIGLPPPPLLQPPVIRIGRRLYRNPDYCGPMDPCWDGIEDAPHVAPPDAPSNASPPFSAPLASPNRPDNLIPFDPNRS